MKKRLKIILVGGARPNFMKVAPVYKELKKYSCFKPIIVHTGQHYDKEMSGLFFRDLQLPRPDIYLGVGSGNHGEQTAKIMIGFENVCMDLKPDLVIVVGDVNSTIACALVAVKLMIPVAHIEAGLRSFDRTMPEEINRLLTDQISDYLFTTCRDANENLRREGIPEHRIFFVGNVMIDTLKEHLIIARRLKMWQNLGLKKGHYCVLTLHRPSNVDNEKILQDIMDGITEVSKILPVVFPVHPRTSARFDHIHFLVYDREFDKGILFIKPLGYLEFLSLMADARFVLTDSGGIQEETTILGIPCLTLRENTERPITITQGTNTLVGIEKKAILKEVKNILHRTTDSDSLVKNRIPELWDGKAASRIAKTLARLLA